jgi:hypothetical protein
MTFEEYQARPVYRAQCKTFAICREFLGTPSGDLATGADHPIMYFRVLPAYRNAYSLALRKRIADIVRAKRKEMA